MSKAPTIWMNVTTSTRWKGPAVGIIRTEQEIARKLKSLYPSGQFKECLWSNDRFIELQHTSDNPLSINQKETDYLLPINPKPQAIKNIAQGAFSLTPEILRPLIDRLLRKLKSLAITFIRISESHKAKKITALISRSSKTGLQLKKPTHCIQQHPFKTGDIFISAGTDWDYEFHKDLYRLRTSEKIRIITFCYDLIPILYPQYCISQTAEAFAPYLLDIAEGSDLVLCISKQSKHDLLEMLHHTGGKQVKTHIISLGDSVPSSEGEVSEKIENIASQPFILFVSTMERRKNHETLYKAYHLICKSGNWKNLPKLIFVGSAGWGVADLIKDIALDPLTKDFIVHLPHVNDAELLKLYQAALFCVFPSLYEGWGLPVGEALALGKYVVSSNRGALPEIGGDLVDYLDPWSPEDWADKILSLSSNKKLISERENLIKSNYQIKTWDQTAASIKREITGILSQSQITDRPQ